MIVESNGLNTDTVTWALFVAVVGLWVLTLALLGKRRDGLLRVPTSLLGAAWVAFGLSFIARFSVLAYDAVIFGNYSDRLLIRPASVVNAALALAFVYWLCVLIGHRAGSRAFAGREVGAGPFALLRGLAADGTARCVYATTLVTTICVLLTADSTRLSSRIFTPVALIGEMWVLPAAVVWHAWFKNPRTPMPIGARWIALLPGVVRTIVSPYREHIAVVVFVVFIASIFAGRRYRMSTVVFAAAVFVVAITPVVEVYRNVRWAGMDLEAAAEGFHPRNWFGHDDEAFVDAPWFAASRRFHAFDSFLLTIDLVPAVFPHSDRHIFTGAVLRSFIPRGFWRGKEESNRGLVFSQTIWGFDDPAFGTEAAIAPSMPGDLFEAGGIPYIVAGGLIWGCLLGLCDRWLLNLPGAAAASALALLTLQGFASVERDFAHCVATLIQSSLVMVAMVYVLVAAIGATSSRPRPVRNVALPRGTV